MNQQQRAGKHLSFSLGRKPFGMTRETFHQRPKGPHKKQRRPQPVCGSGHSKNKKVSTKKSGRNVYGILCGSEHCKKVSTKKSGRNVYGILQDYVVLMAISRRQLTILKDFADRGGSLAAVCFKHDINLNERRDKDGHTILHYAVIEGTVGLVMQLLNAGAKVEEKNKNGESPVDIVIKNEDWDIICVFLQRSPAVVLVAFTRHRNSKATCGQTHEPSRHISSVTAHQHQTLWSYLFEKERRHLPAASFSSNDSSIRRYNRMGVKDKLLIYAGVLALTRRDLTTLKDFVGHGGSLAALCSKYNISLDETRDEDGHTILHDAVIEGTKDMVRVLLEAGAKVDVRNKNGDTPLDIAVKNEDWDIISVFLHHDLSVVDAAVILAITRRHLITLKDFADRGGSLAAVCAKHEISLDEKREEDGHTILHDAVIEGTKDEVRLLLEAGASLDVTHKKGDTPLHIAILCGNWDIVNTLLQHSSAGKIASRRNSYGTTPLHDVVSSGQLDILQTFLLMKADPLVTDSRGNSLVMAAVTAKTDREKLMRLLIQSGMSTHQPALTRSGNQAALTRSENQAALTRSGNQPAFTRSRHQAASTRATHQAALTRSTHQPASTRPIHRHTLQSSPSPLRKAVETGQLRMAMMLYASGACSQQEIHDISTNCDIRTSLENRAAIVKFVEDVSSQPRSLRDLCALTVSRCLGCGPDRGQRAESIGLPSHMCRLVLHEHVVHPDFLKDVCSDHRTGYLRFGYIPLLFLKFPTRCQSYKCLPGPDCPPGHSRPAQTVSLDTLGQPKLTPA